MPAVSKQQQKLFAMVHAYQTGKLSADKVDPRIKRIAKHISSTDAKKYASAVHSDLKELFHSPEYITDTLHYIIEQNVPEYVKGTLVDRYTASLLLTVFRKLNEDNQRKFVKQSIDEMVAVAYKILTD